MSNNLGFREGQGGARSMIDIGGQLQRTINYEFAKGYPNDTDRKIFECNFCQGP